MIKTIKILLISILLGVIPASAYAGQLAKRNGGSGNESANSIVQTSDGGYNVAGATDSFGAGQNDFWVVKLDSDGDVIWQKAYGGSGNDVAYVIEQPVDG